MLAIINLTYVWGILDHFPEVVGLILIGFGIFSTLRKKQKVVTDQQGTVIDVEIVRFGRLRTNRLGVYMLFLGTSLITLSIFFGDKKAESESEPEFIEISGKVKIVGEEIHDAANVGIFPGPLYSVNTDGSFTLKVPSDDTYYTCFAYYREGNNKDVCIKGVHLDSNKKPKEPVQLSLGRK